MRCTIAAILLVACRASGSPSADPVAWKAPIEIAAGGGMKGPWQQNDSQYDFVDDPSVALADDGSAYVAWVDHRNKDVHVRREGRAAAVNVSRSPRTFSWLPRIVVAGKHVHVLWQEIIFSPGGSHGGEILFARSTDGGVTFDPPQNLSNSIAGDGKARITEKIWHNGSLDLARSPSGALYAAWTNYDGALLLATSADGAQWSAPQQLAGSATRPARAPSVVATDERIYVAWTYGETTSADIQVASADANLSSRPLAFTSPTTVATTATYSDAPKLALDTAGALHVAYAETAGDAFAKSRVQYTRSVDGARSFEPPRTLSRGEASFPSLVVDGNTVLVAYERGSAASARDARGLTLAISRDGGDHFVEQPIAGSADREGPNGSQQGRLMSKLAARSGKVAVVNSALRPNERSRVWMIRGHLQTSR